MTTTRKNGTRNAARHRATDARTSAAPVVPAPVTKTVNTATSRAITLEAKPQAADLTAQAVAEAAYFLWLKRGGNDVVNWLEAEAALKTRLATR